MTSDTVLDRYLEQIAARLPARSRSCVGTDRVSDILSELRSGLLDATDCYRSAGMAPSDAPAAAVGEFGSPEVVALAFRRELAARQARSLTFHLAATAIPIGMLWAYAAYASDAPRHGTWPWGWISAPPVPLAIAAAIVATVSATVTVMFTGCGIGWLPDRPRIAATAALVGGFSAAALDLAIIALLVVQVPAGLGRLATLPVLAAAIASLARLTLSRRAARRCVHARASLA
jgi:hypothetical protein